MTLGGIEIAGHTCAREREGIVIEVAGSACEGEHGTGTTAHWSDTIIPALSSEVVIWIRAITFTSRRLSFIGATAVIHHGHFFTLLLLPLEFAQSDTSSPAKHSTT